MVLPTERKDVLTAVEQPAKQLDLFTIRKGLLTRRELDVLRLMAEGASNRAIADALVISSGTVKFHAGSILRKLRAANRAEAVARYFRLTISAGNAER